MPLVCLSEALNTIRHWRNSEEMLIPINGVEVGKIVVVTELMRTVWLKLVFHRELPKYSPISTNNRYNVISDQLLNEPDHAFGFKYAYRTSHQWFHWG